MAATNYTRRQKVKALVLLKEANYNYSLAEKLTNISRQTLTKWNNDIALLKSVDNLDKKKLTDLNKRGHAVANYLDKKKKRDAAAIPMAPVARLVEAAVTETRNLGDLKEADFIAKMNEVKLQAVIRIGTLIDQVTPDMLKDLADTLKILQDIAVPKTDLEPEQKQTNQFFLNQLNYVMQEGSDAIENASQHLINIPDGEQDSDNRD